jgi:hypothetical protein
MSLKSVLHSFWKRNKSLVAIGAILLGSTLCSRAASVWLQDFGGITLGRIGQDSVFLENLGRITVGHIGDERVFLNHFDGMTLGQIGDSRVFIQEFGPTEPLGSKRSFDFEEGEEGE